MSSCACGHDQTEHEPDCQAVVESASHQPDFCACSGFRAESYHESSERFRSGHRQALDTRFPAWTALAACRPASVGGAALLHRDGARPGMPWDKGFNDEVAMKPSVDQYRWPRDVNDAIETCAACPVRRQCLERAFDVEGTTVTMGYANFLIKHKPRCEDMKCDGCVPLKDRIQRREMTLELMHVGVWGGVPGRVRERYANDPDRIERCTDWFEDYASEQGFRLLDQKENLTA